MTTETEREKLADAIDPRKAPIEKDGGSVIIGCTLADLIAASDLIRSLSPTDAHRIDAEDDQMIAVLESRDDKLCTDAASRLKQLLARRSPTRCAELTGLEAAVKECERIRDSYGPPVSFDISYGVADECVAAIRALTALKTEPQGGEWVLVPREPTEAMMRAFNDGPLCADEHPLDLSDASDKQRAWIKECWSAFIAAAPPPPVETGE